KKKHLKREEWAKNQNAPRSCLGFLSPKKEALSRARGTSPSIAIPQSGDARRFAVCGSHREASSKFLSDTRLQTNELPVFSCPQPHPSTFFDEHRERISLRLYSYG